MIKAFTYMFKDNKFIQKALMYFVFVLIGSFCTNYASAMMKAGAKPVLLLIALLGIIILFVPYGYLMSCVKALTEQKENYLLPMFNFKANFVVGFKYMISILILSLLYGIATVIAALVIGLIAVVLKAKLLAIVVLSAVTVIPILLLLFYTIALNWIFAQTQAITSFLQFKKAHALIKQDWARYWKAFGLMFVINFVVGGISAVMFGILSKNIAGIFVAALIGAILASYTVFVNCMLNAKSISPDARI